MAKVRNLEEINREYFQTAAILGDLVWKVTKFLGEDLGTGQIGDLKRKLRTIDNEMDAYQLEQTKLAKKNPIPMTNPEVQSEAAAT
jgi:hypothetical protein